MSLKDKCEKAVLSVLRTDRRLRALFPKQSITADAGTDFPVLWVRAQRPRKMYPEVEIYRVPVQAVLETRFDDPSNDKLFARIERLTQEHALIAPINAGNFGLHVFDNIGGDDAETVAPNYRSQTCALTLVCCET